MLPENPAVEDITTRRKKDFLREEQLRLKAKEEAAVAAKAAAEAKVAADKVAAAEKTQKEQAALPEFMAFVLANTPASPEDSDSKRIFDYWFENLASREVKSVIAKFRPSWFGLRDPQCTGFDQCNPDEQQLLKQAALKCAQALEVYKQLNTTDPISLINLTLDPLSNFLLAYINFNSNQAAWLNTRLTKNDLAIQAFLGVITKKLNDRKLVNLDTCYFELSFKEQAFRDVLNKIAIEWQAEVAPKKVPVKNEPEVPSLPIPNHRQALIELGPEKAQARLEELNNDPVCQHFFQLIQINYLNLNLWLIYKNGQNYQELAAKFRQKEVNLVYLDQVDLWEKASKEFAADMGNFNSGFHRFVKLLKEQPNAPRFLELLQKQDLTSEEQKEKVKLELHFRKFAQFCQATPNAKKLARLLQEKNLSSEELKEKLNLQLWLLFKGKLRYNQLVNQLQNYLPVDDLTVLVKIAAEFAIESEDSESPFNQFVELFKQQSEVGRLFEILHKNDLSDAEKREKTKLENHFQVQAQFHQASRKAIKFAKLLQAKHLSPAEEKERAKLELWLVYKGPKYETLGFHLKLGNPVSELDFWNEASKDFFSPSVEFASYQILEGHLKSAVQLPKVSDSRVDETLYRNPHLQFLAFCLVDNSIASTSSFAQELKKLLENKQHQLNQEFYIKKQEEDRQRKLNQKANSERPETPEKPSDIRQAFSEAVLTCIPDTRPKSASANVNLRSLLVFLNKHPDIKNFFIKNVEQFNKEARRYAGIFDPPKVPFWKRFFSYAFGNNNKKVQPEPALPTLASSNSKIVKALAPKSFSSKDYIAKQADPVKAKKTETSFWQGILDAVVKIFVGENATLSKTQPEEAPDEEKFVRETLEAPKGNLPRGDSLVFHSPLESKQSTKVAREDCNVRSEDLVRPGTYIENANAHNRM